MNSFPAKTPVTLSGAGQLLYTQVKNEPKSAPSTRVAFYSGTRYMEQRNVKFYAESGLQ